MEIIDANNIGAITAALETLRRGGIIVFPTETSYGLGGDWTNPKVHRKIRRIKQRPAEKQLPVIVSSLAMAERHVVFNATARKLARTFWPGPLSLVLPLKHTPRPLSRGDSHPPEGWPKAGVGSLSIRISSHPVAMNLVRTLGKPLIATSANLSGTPPLFSASDIIRALRDKKFKPDLVIDGGTLPRRRPSTVVQVNIDGSVLMLRKGSFRLNFQ